MTSTNAKAVRTHAVILASGTGSRAGSGAPKQFVDVGGRSLLEHSVAVFDRHPRVDDIRVVVAAEWRAAAAGLIARAGLKKAPDLLDGGATRSASSHIGVAGLDPDDRVLVHDAVRPFVTAEIIDRCLDALAHTPAVAVAVPTPDTVIEVDDDGRIAAIPDRDRLRLAQTPQGFHAGVLQRAHELFAADPDATATDDCGLVLRYGLAPIAVVAGERANVKITYPEDLEEARARFRDPS